MISNDKRLEKLINIAPRNPSLGRLNIVKSFKSNVLDFFLRDLKFRCLICDTNSNEEITEAVINMSARQWELTAGFAMIYDLMVNVLGYNKEEQRAFLEALEDLDLIIVCKMLGINYLAMKEKGIV